MSSKFQKTLTLIAIYALSTIFFWSAFNQLLVPSRAVPLGQVLVHIVEDEIKCNPDPNGICRAHIYLDNNSQIKLVGLEGRINYQSGLEFDQFATDTICLNNSLDLDVELKSQNDEANKLVDFTFGTLKPDSDLKTSGCVRAIYFRP